MHKLIYKVKGGRVMNDKNGSNFLIGVLLRACMGLFIIYFVNMYLESQGIQGQVGLNGVSAVTTATLGLPGVGLLYGVTFFQML